MAQTVNLFVGSEDRQRLAAIIADRSRPPKHIQRARIVRHSAARLNVLEVASEKGSRRPDITMEDPATGRVIGRMSAARIRMAIRSPVNDEHRTIFETPLGNARSRPTTPVVSDAYEIVRFLLFAGGDD